MNAYLVFDETSWFKSLLMSNMFLKAAYSTTFLDMHRFKYADMPHPPEEHTNASMLSICCTHGNYAKVVMFLII